ncbi:neural proliferation differentiation and control protein 1-like [Rana temporaria]|uniref:neural proliferation differentiation and control protein 1-like n=1 Tax=Rana temporaria TaxID=8407 RepID=UPI001AADE101|nr:neural proliferation differentiation and control protein 1-like [Rana temporaria]
MVVVGVIVLLVAVTVDSRCPSNLDCVLLKREFCAPGSNVCGPCRHPFEETKTGHCVPKAGSRTKFTGPDSVIDIIQEYRLTKGHRIISTGIASVDTTNIVASAQATSQGIKSPNLYNVTPTRSPSPAAATFSPQLKVKNIGRRRKSEMNQSMSLALTVVCSLTAVSGLLVAALCWYRLQKEVRLAQEMEYKGNHHHPCKRSAAHMSHYVQQYSSQKKQFRARESPEKKPCQQLSTDSEADIEEFGIYECPGLAPTGEMEVHNPLFDPSRTKQ